jgi:CheY-like chemotaxis protein
VVEQQLLRPDQILKPSRQKNMQPGRSGTHILPSLTSVGQNSGRTWSYANEKRKASQELESMNLNGLSRDLDRSTSSNRAIKHVSPADIDIAHVLIVDDTVFTLRVLELFMNSVIKIKVDQAISGEEALMKCQQRIQNNQDAYRLIVMDINMPGMDGVVATAKIREIFGPYVKKRDQKHYLIVAHTALPEDQFGDYRARGFDGFLQKNDNGLLRKYVERVELC